jgi:sigma-B regulation protein RsbU (phosphoserine phosphatase)
MALPAAFQYQQALDRFRREGHEAVLLKRMSELISLLDLTTTLGSSLSSQEILDAALLIVLAELGATRGALLVAEDEATFALRAARGLPRGAPERIALGEALTGDVVLEPGPHVPLVAAYGFSGLSPIRRGGRTIALLGVGPRADGRGYGEEEVGFLRSVSACAAVPIENGLILEELRRVNQKLSLKVFQLRNLFDISRELTASLDEEAILGLTAATLMGQLMVSRCALYLQTGAELRMAHARGYRCESAVVLPADELVALEEARGVGQLAEGPLRAHLTEARMALAVPLALGTRTHGVLAVGERLSGAAFSEEDRDLAFTLGRQAMAALESVRLHRIRLEKERQDRELEIAREIQQSLFPHSCPAVEGFEVAAASRPSRRVGGDHYDFIPLPGGGVALAIADVSGKGTPASILMASVHASLRALAGTAPPERLVARLNAFLFASTQANKFVTLFYAELDPVRRVLRFVNAGHVPPFHLRSGERWQRLAAGGPALGLIEDAAFEAGEAELAPGDVVAMVTDGATEASSPADDEFGDDRVWEALRRAGPGRAEDALAGLVGAVDAWTGPAGCADDLTALILRAL